MTCAAKQSVTNPGRPIKRRDRPWLVGLTGSIAAGKSTVAGLLAELGVRILDADQLARQVMDHDAVLRQRLVESFGPQLIDEQGQLDRGVLGQIVFTDSQARQRLEQLTHPAIQAAAQQQIAALQGQGVALIVYEAALLVETGRHHDMDLLVVVVAQDELRLERLMQRSSLSHAAAGQRLAAQLPQQQKIAVADYVIDNSGTLEETRRHVVHLWQQLQDRLAGGDRDE